MFEGSSTLFRARQASNTLLETSPQLLQAMAVIADKISNQASERPINNKLILGLAVVAVLCLGIIGVTMYRGTRRRLLDTAETNERNQTAILRLLDELADLADGDLTTTATVTEDFTGAIADSINFTIDQLRILVARINETAVNVSAAAQETQQTALHLAEASEHQAQEIAGASAAVNEMAVTIDQVSANAAESAAVAERAVSIAGNGAKVVQNTINGMDTIREQIQDTSKRIKRLGESSQEIGDIVSLINDIADQTNILALNAAIQASMAGDAGRGFAVVADEVQRLAERSAAATKQIEALVKTIQNDTNEAVISMEQTTSEVVRGARLAQDAGVALEEIENVSSSLAELIQNISNAARQQASSAGHISNTMNVIQEITTQTSAGTSATAQSIGNLAEMALDLRESVAGFKLPEELSDMRQPTHHAKASFAPNAKAAPIQDDDDLEIIDLDDEVLPGDDFHQLSAKS
jgi:twitching motility protein PilJ